MNKEDFWDLLVILVIGIGLLFLLFYYLDIRLDNQCKKLYGSNWVGRGGGFSNELCVNTKTGEIKSPH